jgi:hypothetical protein
MSAQTMMNNNATQLEPSTKICAYHRRNNIKINYVLYNLEKKSVWIKKWHINKSLSYNKLQRKQIKSLICEQS